MSNELNSGDSLDFLKSMWNSMGFALPGMVTPTLDVDEIGKRIADMKAVEGWLKMNLNMLQMNIQGLEMQRVALATMQAMSQTTPGTTNPSQASAADAAANPFVSAALNPALWPWNFMQQTPPAAESGSVPAPSKPARTASTSRKKAAK